MAPDLTLRRFLGEAAQELTSVEHSKLLRTLKALLIRPGLLTAEYFSSRRVRYVRPLALCLTILALNVLINSAAKDTSVFNSKKIAAAEGMMLGERSRHVGDHFLRNKVFLTSISTRQSQSTIYNSIDEKWSQNVSLMSLPQIVFMSLFVMLVHVRNGRFLAEHIIFSMHFISFQILATLMMWPLFRIIGVTYDSTGFAIAGVKYALDAVYLIIALKFFYKASLGKTVARAAAIILGSMIVIGGTYQLSLWMAVNSVIGR